MSKPENTIENFEPSASNWGSQLCEAAGRGSDDLTVGHFPEDNDVGLSSRHVSSMTVVDGGKLEEIFGFSHTPGSAITISLARTAFYDGGYVSDFTGIVVLPEVEQFDPSQPLDQISLTIHTRAHLDFESAATCTTPEIEIYDSYVPDATAEHAKALVDLMGLRLNTDPQYAYDSMLIHLENIR